jgi:hypothetical protein
VVLIAIAVVLGHDRNGFFAPILGEQPSACQISI